MHRQPRVETKTTMAHNSSEVGDKLLWFWEKILENTVIHKVKYIGGFITYEKGC